MSLVSALFTLSRVSNCQLKGGQRRAGRAFTTGMHVSHSLYFLNKGTIVLNSMTESATPGEIVIYTLPAGNEAVDLRCRQGQ